MKNKVALTNLAKFLFSNPSKLASTYKLAKILGVTDTTVSQYIQMLEDSFLIYQLPKFDYSSKKQIYNPKKILVADSGLSNLIGFSVDENLGLLLENLVGLELRKKFQESLYYWSNGTEVDFLVWRGSMVEKLINVTTTFDDPKVTERELKSLSIAVDKFPKSSELLIGLYNQSGFTSDKSQMFFDFINESWLS